MSELDERLKGISEEISEHITAVKGTLELIDASVTEDDLSSLIEKAVERMDTLQKLSHEMIAALKSCLEKIEKMSQ
jgi:DNA-binding FrmR family transcriptional regulator